MRSPGMQHEGGIGLVLACCADHAAPPFFVIVLCIAEIKEGKGFEIFDRGAELYPFAAVGSISNAVHVKGAGLQVGEIELMVIRLTIVQQQAGNGGEVCAAHPALQVALLLF